MNTITTKSILTLLLLASALVAMAQQITESQASAIAKEFLLSRHKAPSIRNGVKVKANADISLSYVARADESESVCMEKSQVESTALYYVFNSGDDMGWVIVAGDERCGSPVLGYNLYGHFDYDNVPVNMKGVLDAYRTGVANAISYSTPAPAASTSANRENIAPLLDTQWNQGEPYNLLCPEQDGVLCPTGCVATALAQIMNYYQWPVSVPEVPGYFCSSLNRELEALPATTFDWDNIHSMKGGNNEYTQEQGMAVAKLMQYCGYALEMFYGLSGSGSTLDYGVFDKIFDYQCFGLGISGLTYPKWEEYLYDQLISRRPIYMDGDNGSVGHAFVCDGYSEDGFFHFNWGWGGYHDGYFSRMDMLYPNYQGASVIVPKNDTSYNHEYPLMINSHAAEIASNGSCTFGYGIGNDHDVSTAIGLYADGNLVKMYYIYEEPEVNPNQIRTISAEGLTDGAYEARLLYRERDANDWKEFYNSDYYTDYIAVAQGRFVSCNQGITIESIVRNKAEHKFYVTLKNQTTIACDRRVRFMKEYYFDPSFLSYSIQRLYFPPLSEVVMEVKDKSTDEEDCFAIRVEIDNVNLFYAVDGETIVPLEESEIVYPGLKFEVDDLCYRVTSYEAGEYECEVSPRSVNGTSFSYGFNGEAIIIPDVVKLHDNNIKVTSIGNACFIDCQISAITLPKYLEHVDRWAFIGTKPLTDIYVKCPSPFELVDGTFWYYNQTLHVLKGLKEVYAQHPVWGKFMKIVDDIEPDDADGIEDITAADGNTVQYYSEDGKRQSSAIKGMNIIKANNGKTKKILYPAK